MIDVYKYLNLKREADSILETIAELRARAESLGAQNITDMPKAHSMDNAMENAIVKLTDAQAMYNDKIVEMVEAMTEIEEAISHLPGIESTIMRYKYINGWTLEKIAVELNYSYRSIRRKHKHAIRTLYS